MSLNASYITALDLSESLLDKDTGAPLAGGTVWFYEDASRTTPKLVYELSGAPPNYTYTALPNPITLNAIGAFSDNSGTNVPVYYYPYDNETPANIQLYYIAVYNANGVLQFTREGWPNLAASDNPNTSGTFTNALINPQFVNISFSQVDPLTISFATATTTTTAIAVGWQLMIVSSGAGSVVVTRTAIAGNLAYPGNPPYTLTVSPGANVTSLYLQQTLFNDPDIFSPAVGGVNGWISGSITLAPSSSITLSYQPNGQPAQNILLANNTSGSYEEFNNTIQLSPAANTSTGDSGFVAILLILPISVATTFTNLQIVGLESNIQDIPYIQTPANIQKALMGGFQKYSPTSVTPTVSTALNTGAATGTGGFISGTYYTPLGCSYIKVTLAGGGGGGGGGSLTSYGGLSGSNGANTTFGATLLASGGVGGGEGSPLGGGTLGNPGIGGSPTGFTTGLNLSGSSGCYGCSSGTANISAAGGAGGVSFGGGGAGDSASPNTGGGGGGGPSTAGSGTIAGAGGGGGGGACIHEEIITNPAATYAYVVGAGGAGGAGGGTTGVFPGFAGGSGFIFVTEYYS